MRRSTSDEAWGGVEEFVALSSALSGFSVTELERTGMADAYADFVAARVGAGPCRALLTAPVAAGVLPERLSEELLELARSITQLWYTGSWTESAGSAPTVVSARAYAEGLVWRALGGHAPGTGRPGYGSWSEPPDGGAVGPVAGTVLSVPGPAPGPVR
ncbi:hypothetical protein ACFXGT_37585 [Streptomyces sp. NPDC059352]|uniref:hypothetical protein n=1 Tax=Streptomyces sp. NPDC059352 TaxID=3346810 RepID=UPI0036A7945F